MLYEKSTKKDNVMAVIYPVGAIAAALVSFTINDLAAAFSAFAAGTFVLAKAYVLILHAHKGVKQKSPIDD